MLLITSRRFTLLGREDDFLEAALELAVLDFTLLERTFFDLELLDFDADFAEREVFLAGLPLFLAIDL